MQVQDGIGPRCRAGSSPKATPFHSALPWPFPVPWAVVCSPGEFISTAAPGRCQSPEPRTGRALCNSHRYDGLTVSAGLPPCSVSNALHENAAVLTPQQGLSCTRRARQPRRGHHLALLSLFGSLERTEAAWHRAAAEGIQFAPHVVGSMIASNVTRIPSAFRSTARR